MATDRSAPHRSFASTTQPSDEPDGFLALASALRSIAMRAATERWPGWTDRDSQTIEASAGEIEDIRPALAHGMRQAFDIGREYGHREVTLDRLNAEIAQMSDQLARRAWGRANGAPQ